MTNEINFSELTKKASEENILDVPVTQAVQEEVTQEQSQVDPSNLLNLEDVAYMVMVGRTKNGESFLRTAGVNDLIVVKGLLDYAVEEVKFNFQKFFFEREQVRRIQEQQAAQAAAEAEQAE